MNSSIAMRN